MSIKLDFSVLLRDEYPQWILKGVVTMFELTALAWLLAIAVGTVLAVIRMSNSRIGQALVATYVEYHQNVAMLVQIFIWYFGIPALLPQAIRIALPTLVSHTVLLFKNTSLAMTIGVAELTYATREIESQSFKTVEVYLFSTMVYLVVSMLIMGGGTVLEDRYRIKAR